MSRTYTRFFFTYQGGAVVENVGKCIRRKGRELGTIAWAQRDCQGAIARVRDELYKANHLSSNFYKIKVEKHRLTYDYVVNLENLIWKTHMYVGGSYTAMLHYSIKMGC